MTQRHLLMIDGTNILRRCYEANPSDESTAKAEGAVKSAVGSIMKAVKRHEPTHVFVAFDVPNQRTWRHDVYDKYKSTRKPTPAFMVEKLPDMISLVRERGLFACQVPGYEAEDLISRVARAWVAHTKDYATVASTDKDLLLLTREGVLVHKHFEDVWCDEAWILAKYGVGSEHLGTYFALLGDTVDDIPGVLGVGPKTATKLVNEYCTLEGIYAALDDGRITAKGLRASLEAGRSDAFLSRELMSFKSPELNITMANLRVAV